MFNVYYRSKLSNRMCRYCVSPMDRQTAEQMRDTFNNRYFGKRFPNGRGEYPYSRAWIAPH